MNVNQRRTWRRWAAVEKTLAVLDQETIDKLRMDDPSWLADGIPTQIAGKCDVWLDAMRQIKPA